MENLELENAGRIKSGINGLDEYIQGGFPKGSTIVVTGSAGSGKSIFGMQYLNEGLKNNEKCLYINVEQTSEKLVSQAKHFNWAFDQWENEGRLKIWSIRPHDLFDMKHLNNIKQDIMENNYDRVVIDSITSLVYAPYTANNILNLADKGLGPHSIIEMSRAEVIALIDFLQSHNITTVLVSQKIDGMPGDTYDMTSEFKADGLLLMGAKILGKTSNRTLQIKKLRKTKIDIIPLNFDFTDTGISILKNEEV
jgi:circadian clock protein KaiC